jgi:hypothetical protein
MAGMLRPPTGGTGNAWLSRAKRSSEDEMATAVALLDNKSISGDEPCMRGDFLLSSRFGTARLPLLVVT